MLVHSPHVCSGHGWSEARATNSMLVCDVSGRDPIFESSLAATQGLRGWEALAGSWS